MKRAFTLIELLVVIAIIAILAAILFPVFAQAKLAAKKAVDMSNIKQLALAGEMWKADHEGYLVKAFQNYESGGQLTGITYPFGNWDAALQPYIKNKDIFKSPLDPGLPMRDPSNTKATDDELSCQAWNDAYGLCGNWQTIGPLGARATGDDFASSYRLNSSNQPGWSAAVPRLHFRTAVNESAIEFPAGFLLIIPGGKGVGQPQPYHEVTTALTDITNDNVCIDDVTNVDYDRTARQPANPSKAQRGQGRSNYGFGDGHAANLAWGATWKTLGPETTDRNGSAVAPTGWRQNFSGAPEKCLFREGDPR